MQIDKIINGSPVTVFTLRPHGLVSKDSVEVSGALFPTVIADFTGKKIAKRISDYEFQLFKDTSFSLPVSSVTTIDYLRLNKLGAIETSKPDTLAFLDNHSGVQINGGSAKNQPSYYVASFDGLNENGVPYNTVNPIAKGETDSLRSQRFDLSTYTVGSNIYMSYYYQHGGYGEQPDATDHLYLDFLDNTSTWNQVKDISGANGSADSFYIAMVPINDAKYFHSAFQYRFRSYGRQTGAYDVWNLDYIYINRNRTTADTTIRDYAIRNGNPTFLTTYTAMPFNHFFVGNKDSTTYFNKTLKTIVTHQANFPKPKVIEVKIKDQFQNSISSFQGPTDTDAFKDSTYTNTLTSVFFPVRTKPVYIDLSYSLADNQRTDASVNTTSGPIELMFNNVITKRTYLYDYYAYDDSQAESGFGSTSAGVKMAYQFVSERQDSLTHVDICFTRNKDVSLENSQIFLMAWGDSITTELYKQPIAIQYPNSPNGFIRYKIEPALVINAGSKFHIGYQKNFAQLLTVGYDRNKDARSKSFYADGNTWYRMDTPLADVQDAGSMMMRPVFYKTSNNIPLGIKQTYDNVNKNALLLYPNPASTTIDIIATDEIKMLYYTMYSLYGQTIASGVLTSTDHTLNIASLSSGMYLILCTDTAGQIYATRFVKE
jgi:Secretion system C-terminal sorting domain